MRALRPHSFLLRQGLVASIVSLTPIFGVLYFLTIPNGPWAIVVATQAVATIAITLACSGYFAVAIWVAPGVIAERGFFGRKTRFEASDIGSILVAHTYASPDLTPIPQLFVCDHDGKQLVRMRGQFWSRESMDAVIEALPVPVTETDGPVSIADLRHDFPGLLYWFERHPIWAGLAFTGIVALFGGVLLLVLQLPKLF